MEEQVNHLGVAAMDGVVQRRQAAPVSMSRVGTMRKKQLCDGQVAACCCKLQSASTVVVDGKGRNASVEKA